MAEKQNPISPTDDAGEGIQDATNENIEIIETSETPTGNLNRVAKGTSGTFIFSDFYDEEYLSKLTGTRRADIFDEITRSDDVITMLLTARKNPILKAVFDFQEPDIPEGLDDAQKKELEQKYKKITAHCRHEFFERSPKDFKEHVEESLTFVEHGFSIIERVHEIVSDPIFGQYVGYKNLAWRSQRTIEQWKLNRDGSIAEIFQQADGDLESHTTIDGRFINVFTLRKKGDNYEGLAALRPIYGNWQRKQMFLKLLAIGFERYFIKTPIGKVPAGKEESSERKTFVKMLKSITSHQNNYMTLAEGWGVEFLDNDFDLDKAIKAIAREDEGMVKSFVANHLNLGQGGGSGSYSLGTDLSDQFLSIIENDADIITRVWNKQIIREFVDFNYGKQSVYPKLVVSGINDKFSKEMAEIIKMLVDGRVITATESLEIKVRERLGLPDLLESDKELIPDVREPEPKQVLSEPETGHKLQLADLRKTKSKVKGQLETSAMLIAQGMQEELRARSTELIDKTINRLKKEKPSSWRKVLRTSDGMPASVDYKRKLQKALAETAGRAISQARNEVPGGRKVEFAEGIKSRMSLTLAEDKFKNLPKNTKELILTDSKLVVDSQFTAISNALIFSANGAVDETDDVEIIRKRMQEEQTRKIDGQGKTGINGSIVTAAADLTAKTYNTSRLEFFQVPEVLDKIEAFQFENIDPVSPICQDLVGRIFPKNDPESARFLPPLHHNCKSFIVPLFQLQGKEVSPEGLKPSSPKLEKFITLKEQI